MLCAWCVGADCRPGNTRVRWAGDCYYSHLLLTLPANNLLLTTALLFNSLYRKQTHIWTHGLCLLRLTVIDKTSGVDHICKVNVLYNQRYQGLDWLVGYQLFGFFLIVFTRGQATLTPLKDIAPGKWKQITSDIHILSDQGLVRELQWILSPTIHFLHFTTGQHIFPSPHFQLQDIVLTKPAAHQIYRRFKYACYILSIYNDYIGMTNWHTTYLHIRRLWHHVTKIHQLKDLELKNNDQTNFD